MKVTKQELYLVGFFHLANLVKDPFEAFIMNDMFKDQFIDLTKHRRDTLAFFTNEDSSFYTRCEGMGLKEGEPGDKLLKQVQEFADQMFSPKSKFISIKKNNLTINVKEGLNQLGLLLGTRQTLRDILVNDLNLFLQKEPDSIDPNFVEMVKLENKVSTAFMLRILSVIFCRSFNKYSAAILKYSMQHLNETGEDLLKDENFDPSKVDSLKELNESIEQISYAIMFILDNLHEDDDVEFSALVSKFRKLNNKFAEGFENDSEMTKIETEYKSTFANYYRENNTKLRDLIADFISSESGVKFDF